MSEIDVFGKQLLAIIDINSSMESNEVQNTLMEHEYKLAQY